MRVIIDTNILVSGLISEHGAPAKIVDAMLEGQIIPVMRQLAVGTGHWILDTGH